MATKRGCQANSPAPISAAIRVKSRVMGTQSWPIIRRDTEFAAIRSALVEEQGVCGIVVIGDAGVGKTTLARSVTQLSLIHI